MYYIFKAQYCTQLKADILYSNKKICTSLISFCLLLTLPSAMHIYERFPLLCRQIYCVLWQDLHQPELHCAHFLFCIPLINTKIFTLSFYINSELCVWSLASVIHYSQTGYLHILILLQSIKQRSNIHTLPPPKHSTYFTDILFSVGNCETK